MVVSLGEFFHLGAVMSLNLVDNKPPVHFPSMPDKFQFDKEVSQIFPDMAKRSIPLYQEAHRLHASLLLEKLKYQDRIEVWDIGASRGGFFKEICNQLQVDEKAGDPRLSFVAVDSSKPMLALLQEELPWVATVHANALELVELVEPADIISMFYILQFIRDDRDKLKVLQWANRNLRKGGVLLLGQKETTSGTYAGMFDREYKVFRKNNGYTDEEIAAKTRALANSMWPSTPAWMEDMCYKAGFGDYAVTTRWLQFSTSICTK